MDLYQSLDASVPEIRLFTLFASPSPNAPLEGELKTVSLTDLPPYEALSYAWGAQEFTEPVIVNSKTILVTVNLAVALRNLRKPGEPRPLWIDAVCIDQSSSAERSHQVTLMQSIYSQCQQDILWLGLSGPYKDMIRTGHVPVEGFDLMRRLASKDVTTLKAMEDHWEGSSASQPYRLMAQRGVLEDNQAATNRDGDVHEKKLLYSEESTALYYMLSLPAVWNRVWVMQELAVAPKIQLVAGSLTLDWETISAFLGDSPYADAFHSVFSHGSVGRIALTLFSGIQAIDHQRRIMQEVKAGNGESKLLDVLARFRSKLSSDPRDKIYGLLGLTTDTLDIKPDYEKTTQQVYIDATRSIIDHAGHLDIICQSPWRSPRKRLLHKGLPSWAADFQEDGSVSLFAQRAIFNAGRPACERPCRIIDNTKLCARGVALGVLAEIRQDDYAVDGKRTNLYVRRVKRTELLGLTWLKLYLGVDLLKDPSSKHTYVNGEPAFTAYWRTLLKDCSAFPMTRLKEEQILEADQAAKERLLDALQDGSDEAVDEEDWLPDPKMRNSLGRIVDDWTFAMTENGLYALILQPAKEGDVIACLDGGKVPMVLRPIRASDGGIGYKFVNVAYVHGFMNMEAITDEKLREKLKLEDQDFLLI
ncbi:Heterokaryon incompatibility protein [Paramyrothecium foliicola]|nr:Heterokaryon incompatibility protein [Paramyrothecium foliicola]